MADTFSKLFRTVIVAAVALAGMLMAAVFIVSTAVAFGVVYLLARLAGKPATIEIFRRAPWQRRGPAPGTGASPGAGAPPRKNAPVFLRPKPADVIDVEVREI
ncbi:hypothetical protein GCM10023144_26130 [Pigmentiphaga soli]|uniref:Uncharacterized protein n=1 Tax=Pigmentiphaga soli TaxID=1007095 RepID=A0ABP8H4J0_9BURK